MAAVEREPQDKEGEQVLQGQPCVFSSTSINLTTHRTYTQKAGNKTFYIFFITSLDNKISHKPEEYCSFMRRQKLVSQLFSLGMNLLKISL